MKKMLAGPVVAGVLMLGPAALAHASNPETTPPVDTSTADDDDDDDSGRVGLIGLLGLAGLAGLAGLRRRETVTRYDTQPPVR